MRELDVLLFYNTRLRFPVKFLKITELRSLQTQLGLNNKIKTNIKLITSMYLECKT